MRRSLGEKREETNRRDLSLATRPKNARKEDAKDGV